jgi:hypothetical protein
MLSISAVTAGVSVLWGIFFYTDKKEITFSTYTVYKEIQKGLVAKSCMTHILLNFCAFPHIMY